MRMTAGIVRPLVQSRGHGRGLTLPHGFHDFASLSSQTTTRDDETTHFRSPERLALHLPRRRTVLNRGPLSSRDKTCTSRVPPWKRSSPCTPWCLSFSYAIFLIHIRRGGIAGLP